jgi:hypothetical protein
VAVVAIDFGVFVPTSFDRPSHLRLEGFEASLSAVEGVEASFRTMTLECMIGNVISTVPLYLVERTISWIERERKSVSQFVTWRSSVKLESLSVSVRYFSRY